MCASGPQRTQAIASLLLTGTSGAGKSVVGSEVFEQLVASGRGSAFIDLDAIAMCDAGDDPGYFGSTVMAENLASIWPNYRRRSVTKLVLARAVPDAAELDRIRTSIPEVRLTVGLLVSDPAVLAARLAQRDAGARSGRYIAGAVDLQERIRGAQLADFTLENGEDRSVSAVAAEVIEQWATSRAETEG